MGSVRLLGVVSGSSVSSSPCLSSFTLESPLHPGARLARGGNFYMGDEMKSVSAFCLLLLLFIAGAVPAGAAESPADFRFSTYLGGPGTDQGRYVAVAPSGSVFVAGWTWPPGPYYPSAGFDSFLAGFAPDGSILFSTGFYGYMDISMVISGIAVSNGRVVVGMSEYHPSDYGGGYVASIAQSGGPVVEGWPQIDAWSSEIYGVGAGPGGVWVCGR